MEVIPQALEPSIDYSSKLNAINDNLLLLIQGVTGLTTMFYWLLAVGTALLLSLLFYKFLKIFI